MSTGSLDIEITIATKKRRSEQPKLPASLRIPRITRLMALAIKFQEMVRRGEVRDYADLARLGYVSRARITQIMNLLNLAPDIQEEILHADLSRPGGPPTERHLRELASLVRWSDQRNKWCYMRGGPGTQSRAAKPHSSRSSKNSDAGSTLVTNK